LLLYDEEKKEMEHIDNRAIENEAHGAGPQTAQKLFGMQPDVLITGNGPGGNAATVLGKAGTTIYTGAGEMTVKEAYEAYKNGQLSKF
ncbi:MAG: NifB/NifX family molybdenum-iron cluster-binding protein, partial [Bacteroidales bacterium]|nr:NifB/NifX family molybdenum-iron cluster-binding protein [Bacteroidales bacterium]